MGTCISCVDETYEKVVQKIRVARDFNVLDRIREFFSISDTPSLIANNKNK